MSQSGEAREKEKSTDKKEIAEEEREKMLNAENARRQDAPETQETGEEQRPKRKIPIGGIKMPGFCRTKSKEPCKVPHKTILRIFPFFVDIFSTPGGRRCRILKRICVYIRDEAGSLERREPLLPLYIASISTTHRGSHSRLSPGLLLFLFFPSPAHFFSFL